MKQQVSPAVMAIVIIIVVGIAGFFLWKGAQGDTGTKSPGEVGNASPFSPGGEAIKQGGGAKPAAAGAPGGSRPPGASGGG